MSLSGGIMKASFASNSSQIVSLHAARPITPSYESSMDKDCLVYTVVSNALEENSTAK
jgi:hypothetical protein